MFYSFPFTIRVATDAFADQISDYLTRLTNEVIEALLSAEEQNLNAKDFASTQSFEVVVSLKDFGGKFPAHFGKLLFVCRRATNPSGKTPLARDEWPALMRKTIVDFLLQHVTNAKYFTTCVLPLFGHLKFEKPDLYDPGIELDS